jgi:hypothetical protein
VIAIRLRRQPRLDFVNGSRCSLLMFRTRGEPVWNHSWALRPTNSGRPPLSCRGVPMQRNLVDFVGFTVFVCFAIALVMALWT